MLLRRPSRRGPRRGATAVEVAVTFSVFILFVFAIIEYGRFIMIRQVVENAAREGARLGIIQPDSTAIDTQVRHFLANQPLDTTVTSTAKDPDTFADKPIGSAGFGDMIVVQVSSTYKPLLPTFGFLPNTVTIRATSVMRCESN